MSLVDTEVNRTKLCGWCESTPCEDKKRAFDATSIEGTARTAKQYLYATVLIPAGWYIGDLGILVSPLSLSHLVCGFFGCAQRALRTAVRSA